MSMLSYRELLSSLDEFEGTTIDGMSLLFAIGWLRSLANILAFMLTLPEIDQDTTILQLKHHIVQVFQNILYLLDFADSVSLLVSFLPFLNQ